LGLGAAGLAWCLVAHYPTDDTVAVSLTPEFLVGSGPYRLSRNPMYLSEEAVWLGWSIYFGSPLLVGCGLSLAAAMRYAVGREERTLEGRFAESWRSYAETVPRWF
jgi:protein-S-isoprenylcysteine O-methyltransferase Ste14